MLNVSRRNSKSGMFSLIGAVVLSWAFLFSNSSLASSCTKLTRKINYTVRAGDTLGSILYSHDVGPLWGPHRYVEVTAKINAVSTRTTLMPGQVIVIPLKCEEEALVFARKDLPTIITTENINVPSPMPVPQTEPAKVIERQIASENPPDDGSEYSMLVVDLIGQYTAMIGTDKTDGTSGRLLSKFDPGVRLAWMQNWNSFLQSNIFAEVQNVSLVSEKSGTPLNNSTMTNSSFGFGMNYLAGEKWKIGATIAQRPEMFYQAAAVGNGLEFSAVPLLSLTPEVTYKVLQGRKLSLSLHGKASFYSGAAYSDYTIEAGSGYEGGVSIMHQLPSGSDFHCYGFYGERKQNTSLLDFSEKQTGLVCGFGWKL